MMRKLKLSGTILFVGLLIYSCSTDDPVFESSQIAFLRSGSSDLVEIKYEIDYSIIVKDEENLSQFDRAAISPIVEKQKVNMIIRENGDVRLVTEKIQGRNSFVVPHQTLPNNLPKIVKTVLDGGKMDLFDSQNNLIRSIDGQSMSMPIIAEHAKKILSKLDIAKILSCQRTGMSSDSLDNLIANPPSNVVVTEIKDDIYTIKMPIPSELNSTEAREVVNIIDTRNKVLLGSRLYGDNDKVLQCIMYRYKDCIMKGFKQEVNEILPSGTEVTMQTFADIENLEINYLQ